MDPSRRQRIVSEIVLTLQTITVAAGYNFDLGENVNDWRTHYDEDELPALGVYDLTEEAELTNDEDPKAIQRLPVHIRIFIASNTLAIDARKMIADVLKAIKTNPRWKETGSGDHLAWNSKPMRDGFILPDDNFQIAGAFVEFEVAYMAEVFNAL